MPKKLSYQYVKENVDSSGNILLSKDYINSSSLLTIQCKCGNIYKKSFIKFSLGQKNCPECSKKRVAKNSSLKLDYIKDFIAKNNCEYISGEYKNNTSKLKIKCSCGNVFEKDFAHFRKGQITCKECSNKRLKDIKTKYNLDEAKRLLQLRGYTIIDEYINAYIPFKCMCPKGHITNIVLVPFLNNHSGCKKCANENLKGENNWNYKGGESEVIDHLRKCIKEWKKDILAKYHYKCYVTGSNKNIVIHHLKSFNTILKESCEELNLPLYSKIKDYSKNDFTRLEETLKNKHTINDGIVLQRNIHNEFHLIYGKGNNTIEQFNEFLIKYYPSVSKDNNFQFNFYED